MLDKDIDNLSAEDLQGLIDNGVLEQKTIEYKQSLPGHSDSEKKEFLADVSSFANASGGYLLYGIAQDPTTGKPVSLKGLDTDNADQVIQRLEGMIRDGIEPRIPAIATKPIVLQNSRMVLAMSIPKSWISPHRVCFQRWDKFYSRTSNGKYSLDVSELRIAFSASEALGERIRDFRRDRVGKIIGGETPVPLGPGAKIALHLVPAVSFRPGQSYDVGKVASNPSIMPPIQDGGLRRRYNIDGLVVYSGDMGGTPYSYVQLFRNGIMEAVEREMLQPDGERKLIPSVVFERELIQSVGQYLLVLKSLNVEPPVFVFLGLLEVKGYGMAVRYGGSAHTIDRELLLPPEAVVESYDAKADGVLRPVFDSIWNACDFERSPNYNEAGEWGTK